MTKYLRFRRNHPQSLLSSFLVTCANQCLSHFLYVGLMGFLCFSQCGSYVSEIPKFTSQYICFPPTDLNSQN